jgi:hypothetical protein
MVLQFYHLIIIGEISDCNEIEEIDIDQNIYDRIDRLAENLERALENTELLKIKANMMF